MTPAPCSLTGWASRTGHDYGIAYSATKLKPRKVWPAVGRFIHNELGSRVLNNGIDEFAPTRLMLRSWSALRSFMFVPVRHMAPRPIGVDEGIKDGHDDPQKFSLMTGPRLSGRRGKIGTAHLSASGSANATPQVRASKPLLHGGQQAKRPILCGDRPAILTTPDGYEPPAIAEAAGWRAFRSGATYRPVNIERCAGCHKRARRIPLVQRF
jgi:hypothetical protein